MQLIEGKECVGHIHMYQAIPGHQGRIPELMLVANPLLAEQVLYPGGVEIPPFEIGVANFIWRTI